MARLVRASVKARAELSGSESDPIRGTERSLNVDTRPRTYRTRTRLTRRPATDYGLPLSPISCTSFVDGYVTTVPVYRSSRKATISRQDRVTRCSPFTPAERVRANPLLRRNANRATTNSFSLSLSVTLLTDNTRSMLFVLERRRAHCRRASYSNYRFA